MVQPILQWAGGKRRLIPQFSHLIPDFDTYYEPFLGGGAVFFHLLSEGKLNGKEVFLNDSNPHLVNVYECLLGKGLFLTFMSALKTSLAEYHKGDFEGRKLFFNALRSHMNGWLSSYSKPDPWKAADFILFNRICFNGLYRVNKSGKINTPFGNGKDFNFDFENLKEAARLLRNTSNDPSYRNVHISCQTVEDILFAKENGENVFVYLDPPYLPVSKTANFTQYSVSFGLQEHKYLVELMEMFTECGVKAMLSGSDTDFYRQAFKSFNIYEVFAGRNINSDATKRGKVKELLITNYEG